MTPRAEERRGRRAKFHGSKCSRGSDQDRMSAAWDWLRVELTDTDRAVAAQARAAITSVLLRAAEDLNAQRGVRS